MPSSTWCREKVSLELHEMPNESEYYGKNGDFQWFVRNRYFSNSPFTGKVPIFINVSVNGSDFAKCSAAHHLLNHCTWLRLRSKRWFLRFARNLRPHCFGEGKQVKHFPNFLTFYSTFEAARPVFGGVGRTFSQFFGFLFYFQGSTPRFWWRR